MQQHNCLCSHTAFRIIFKPSSLNIFLPQYISQYTSLQSNQFWLFSNPTNSFPIYFSSNTFPNISLPQYISQCAFAVSHTAFQIIFQPSRLNIFPNAFLQGGLRPNDLCVHKIFPHHSNLVPACFLSLFFSFLTQLTWSLSLLCWIPMCASSSHFYWGCMSRTRSINNGDFIISRILIQFKGLSWIWAEFRPFYESLQCTLVYFRGGQTSWQCLESIYKIKADFGSICRIEADFRFILGTF